MRPGTKRLEQGALSVAMPLSARFQRALTSTWLLPIGLLVGAVSALFAWLLNDLVKIKSSNTDRTNNAESEFTHERQIAQENTYL